MMAAAGSKQPPEGLLLPACFLTESREHNGWGTCRWAIKNPSFWFSWQETASLFFLEKNEISFRKFGCFCISGFPCQNLWRKTSTDFNNLGKFFSKRFLICLYLACCRQVPSQVSWGTGGDHSYDVFAVTTLFWGWEMILISTWLF